MAHVPHPASANPCAAGCGRALAASGNTRRWRGLWLWLADLIRGRRRPTHGEAQPPCVPVWDVRLSAYRCVDLDNRHDPLWLAARELVALRQFAQAA
ncbi:MAG: hypothetical protein ACYSTY_00825 [Planctomycetota bacterium]